MHRLVYTPCPITKLCHLHKFYWTHHKTLVACSNAIREQSDPKSLMAQSATRITCNQFYAKHLFIYNYIADAYITNRMHSDGTYIIANGMQGLQDQHKLLVDKYCNETFRHYHQLQYVSLSLYESYLHDHPYLNTSKYSVPDMFKLFMSKYGQNGASYHELFRKTS